MKTTFHFLSIIIGSLLSQSACGDNQENNEVDLSIRDEKESIVMRLNNSSDEEKRLRDIFNFSIQEKEPGLIFSIRDESGAEKKLCAMIDKSRTSDGSGISKIESKKAIEKAWKKDMLARRYCLFPGNYSIQIYLVQEDKKVESNVINYENEYKP